jgi:hypothetical protein
MELALNLGWLVIAVVSFILLAANLATVGVRDSRRPGRCQCIAALSCALVILFPVISLTDDLHDIQAAAEEPSSTCVVMKKGGVNHSLTPVRASLQLHYIHTQFLPNVCWLACGVPVTRRAACCSLALASDAQGRAPPSVLSSILR